MDCKLIRGDLVAFQFGSIDDATRARVESHLVDCPACLRAFLALKRETETASAAPRPSAEARARLRRAVAQEVARPQRVADWWRRPLTFGFAAVATAATLLAVVSVRMQLHQLSELASPTAIERGGPR